MRLPDSAQTSRPWRIHELTRDFRIEDVWALPTPGGPEDFPRLVAASRPRSTRPEARPGPFGALRHPVEARGAAGLGRPGRRPRLTVPTLRDRLPADLRAPRPGPDFAALPFSPLYVTDDEWAAEIANRTVHGIMHIGWVRTAPAATAARWPCYVKPNGLLGGLPGRDQAVPAPDRVPGDAPATSGGGGKVGREGLEPSTLGLRGPCSTN